MKFVEHNGADWAAVQLKAVEMEIEKQKRDWEEKRLAQKQLEEQEKQQSEREDNELLTYSREDAMNKVNIRSRRKSQVLGKRKSEPANPASKADEKGKKSNGTGVTQNGIAKGSGKVESPTRSRRNTRIASVVDESRKIPTRARKLSLAVPQLQRATSRKTDRSLYSTKGHIRSPSESTSRSAAESTSHQTTTTSMTTPYDSDSECSLDVMVDSTDVNDSDSNSNLNGGNLHNEDSLASGDSKSLKEASEDGKVEGTPRTRSRGTVKINLWTLDESPILPPKRQKLNNSKSFCEDEKLLKAEFGVKECKISIVDVRLKPPEGSMIKPSPKSRTQKRLLTNKNNHTLDSWIQKPADGAKNRSSNDVHVIKEEPAEPRVTRQRRNTILMNNTL